MAAADRPGITPLAEFGQIGPMIPGPEEFCEVAQTPR